MYKCIIFDLDGTLVDSEPLCNKAFLDLLPNLHVSVDYLISQFRGRKLSDIFDELEILIGQKLPRDFETAYRAQVELNFASSLEAFPDVHDVLHSLNLPVCIASSGPMPKIISAIEKTGLKKFFSDKIFSSYEISKWKPDPSLFLYAASEMGTDPENCIVVEDSTVGLTAAKSAGMTPLQFCHGTIPIDGVESFTTYRQFPQKLKQLSENFQTQ